MQHSFRSLTVADYTAAMQLWNATPGVRTTETPDMFCRFLERNPACSCSVWNGQQLIGAVLCGHDGRRGYLYHLAVHEAYRRQGIATKMVEFCLTELKANGIEKCSLFIFPNNLSGLAFWQQNGWRERIDLRLLAKDL
jgi:N-acetylglutamate synthase